MKRRVFLFDVTRCFGCYGCVAACAGVNRTAPHVFWRAVHKLPPEEGNHDTIYLSLSCNHCADAPCVKACPSGTLVQRTEDGVVIHHQDRCIGCRYCQMACPYDALHWEEERGVVSKCNFCHERLDTGEDPACVATCFSGALTHRVIETPGELKDYQREVPGFTHHSHAMPSIRFITRWENSRSDRRKRDDRR